MEPYMKICRLHPAQEMTMTLLARVLIVALRPDGKFEITYQIHGGVNSDSIVVSHGEASRLLGVGWKQK
jgi:hypothetical protein